MKFNRITVSLALVLASTMVGFAQEGVQKSQPVNSSSTTAAALSVPAGPGRAAIIKLKSGESITCMFLQADEGSIEIETAHQRQQIKLDAVASIIFSTQSANDSAPAALQGKTAPLLLLSSHCERKDRFAFVKGEVKNVTSKTLKNVMVVGSFLSKTDALLKAEQVMLGDLLQGQTLSFNVVSRDNPRIESCEVSFAFFRGAVIPHTDSSQ